ncbi:MAG TPA: carboxypeptidase-like regulatory domain-containing protein [Gemmatimonadaceae bacterium]|nr:carboxypeptidase-like regulatory domain-containing protein [Gemmatimonadaceae bacterium]
MRTVRHVTTALTLTTAALQPAAAQRVRGTVRDSASAQPIPGAVVWVADSAGGFLARAVGGPDGSFAVPRFAGSAALHVLRIGFHPAVIQIRDVSPDSVLDVRLGSFVLALDAVASSRRRVCPGDKGTSDALDLWEQARAALMASVVARDANPPDLSLRSFTRTYEPFRNQLQEQIVRSKDLTGDRSYVAARPAWAFAAEGYMREDHGGERTYYAPDDAVLLDSSFAETHCLHVVPGERDHAEHVGIGFDPVSERGRDTLVDVRGVLWIDATRHELRSLEFQYTGLEQAARTSGGDIKFEVMPNGAPMITRWSIRSAVLAAEVPITPVIVQRRPRDRRDRTDVRVLSWREEGGAVATAKWPDGRSWRGALRTISGKLVGELGRPITDARVWLWNAPDTVTSDSTGTYAFSDVLPGVYLVYAADSALARVDLPQGRRIVDVRDNDHRDAAVLVVPRRYTVAARCKGQKLPPESGVVLGRVVDPSGEPIAEASIEVRWTPRPADNAARQRPDRSLTGDDDGRFAVCGVPLGATVRLRAAGGGQAIDVEWTQSSLMTVSVVLRGG